MNAKQPAGLTVTDLPLVLALARTRTLAAAAEYLDVDASTVFRRLNALEQRLHVRLFDRSPRGYHLTSAGERASAAAERIETELHALDRDITGRDQQLSGMLRITASETLSHAVLPKLFAEFRAQHRHIQLVLTIDNRVLDLGRRDRIGPPAQRVFLRVALRFRCELRDDSDHVDAAKHGLNRLLAIGLKKFMAQQAVALDLP